MSTATVTIVGQNFGAKQYERVLETYKKGISLGVIILLILGLIIFLTAEIAMYLFTDNETVIKYGSDYLKISSLIMVPLMLWFLVNFVSLYDSSYNEILAFLSSQPSKLLFSLFLVSMFFYSALSISEVFEDYIHVESTKKLLNIGVFLSSLIIPLFTIILISNL